MGILLFRLNIKNFIIFLKYKTKNIPLKYIEEY